MHAFTEPQGIYIFDIDGTLADVTHRVHHLEGEKPDWEAFYKAAPDDPPKIDVLEIYCTLVDMGYKILLMTGRPDRYRQETEGWLEANLPLVNGESSYYTLFMRPEGDGRPDHVLKEEWVKDYLRVYPNEEVIGVFEDRNSVVEMWRSNGFTCLQVADGDF